MRCLVVADLHYSLPQFDWLVDVAPLFDLVVLAGDALDIGSIVDFRAQSVVVQKYLARVAGITRIIVCSGNHDLDERNPEGEKVARWVEEARELGVAIDGDTLTIGDTLFTVCPWWDGPLVREGIARQLAEAVKQRQGRWIWAHHAPPANSPTSWGGSRHLGDKELVDWIGEHKPDIVLSGHVHQSPFIRDGSWYDKVGETWVFNAGHQFGRPPARPHRDRPRCPDRLLAVRSGPAGYPSRSADDAPGAKTRRSAGLDHSLGSCARSDPREAADACWLTRLSSTSPTMARWSPWPAYCRLMSAR